MRFLRFIFSEYKMWLLFVVSISFLFFIASARGGTFFSLTLHMNPDLESGLVGHWTLDGKDINGASSTDRVGGNAGDFTNFPTGGGATKETFTTATVGQTWTVPTGVTSVTVKAWGAGGGNTSNGNNGGGGGFIQGTFTVTAEEDLSVRVGGGGAWGNGGGGGGYSGFFRSSDTLLVAGGGGGAGGYSGGSAGGPGGGETGTAGTSANGTGGGGGTQSAGGSAGSARGVAGSSLAGGVGGNQGSGSGSGGTGGTNGGANGGSSNTSYGGGGGGGGGYYGGGGGGAATAFLTAGGGGGGGSSYATSTATATSTSAGSGITAGNSGDGDYEGSAGQGADLGSGELGNDGLVVLSYIAPVENQVDVVPGRLGSAVEFNGTNEYIDIGATGETVKSVAFWIKADSTTEDILDLNGTADITVSGGTISANSFTSPTIYVDGEVSSTITTGWHHVVITTATGISASNMDIGRANGSYFAGRLDDVRIYDRALSATEVERLAQLGMTTTISATINSNSAVTNGLLGHWTLDGKDSTVSTTTDIAGSNDGSINGNEDLGDGGAQTDTYSSAGSGSWVAPDGVTTATIHCWGGGGGGGNANNSGSDGGGGGGGAFASSTVSVTPGNSYSYTVGSGGSAASAGSDTSFNTSFCIADGGSGGGTEGGGAGGTTVNSSGTVEYAGGAGASSAASIYAGGGGGSGGTGSAGNAGGLPTAATAVTGGGPGGGGGTGGGSGSSPASGPGGGGGGGDYVNESSFGSGASGYDGQIKVYYTTPATTVKKAVPGRLGSAMEFDGVDDYIDISGVAASIDETKGTIAAWVYIPTSELDGSGSGIVEVGDNSTNNDWIGFRMDTSDRIQARYKHGGTSHSITKAASSHADQWTHIAFTWDTNDDLVLYINGEQSGSTGTKTGDITGGLIDQAFIGNEAEGTPNQYFSGRIDDVRIYDRAISTDEALRLAQLGMTTHIGVTPPENPNTSGDLVGHWTFDGKYVEGTTTASSTVGSAHGTINGTDISISTPGKIGSAFKFDGVNDYVDISGVAGSVDETQGSIAAWVYVPSAELDGVSSGIVSIGDANSGSDRVSFRTTNSDKIAFDYEFSNTTKRLSVSAVTYADQWVHLVGTWDSDGNSSFYVNGALSTGPTARGGTISGGLLDQATIGVDAESTPNMFFKGRVDDVRIYSVALSATEVQRLYETGN